MIAFVNWPKFNMGGALATSYNLVDTSTVTTVAYLQNSAIANTLLGLSAAILTSILFASKETKEDRLKFKCYIDCFINVPFKLSLGRHRDRQLPGHLAEPVPLHSLGLFQRYHHRHRPQILRDCL